MNAFSNNFDRVNVKKLAILPLLWPFMSNLRCTLTCPADGWHAMDGVSEEQDANLASARFLCTMKGVWLRSCSSNLQIVSVCYRNLKLHGGVALPCLPRRAMSQVHFCSGNRRDCEISGTNNCGMSTSWA